MKTALFAAGLFASAAADKPESYYQDLWKQFQESHNEHAPSNDGVTRYDKFKANVKIIDDHNALVGRSYTLGVNEFADLSWDEFAAIYLGYKSDGKRWGDLPKEPFPNITDVADSVDWVSKGAVTPVKNQQQCGSCWAFSTTGSLEGAYFVASGKLESLSEEDLVQCDHNGDQGCSGGLMDNAFSWVQQNGICSESDYPYTSGSGRTGTCQSGCSPVVTITGHTDVPSEDEEALKAAVSKQPVSVAIEADKSAFQLYKSGVLDSSSCGTQLDHGVLIVGYGTDGKDYWKVKNSWGATWGEQGYLRMVRNKNMCGIAQQPSYPTGAKAASARKEASVLASCTDADTSKWNADAGHAGWQSDMTSCGTKCLGKGSCVSSCMAGKGWSSGCAGCFGTLADCTAQHCLAKCINGRTPDCVTCLKAAGCDTAAFGSGSCTGFDAPSLSVIV